MTALATAKKMSQAELDALGYPVYGTQGGGLVAWCPLNKDWYFVEEPDWSVSLAEGDPHKLPVGSFMPEQWSLGGRANTPIPKPDDEKEDEF